MDSPQCWPASLIGDPVLTSIGDIWLAHHKICRLCIVSPVLASTSPRPWRTGMAMGRPFPRGKWVAGWRWLPIFHLGMASPWPFPTPSWSGVVGGGIWHSKMIGEYSQPSAVQINCALQFDWRIKLTQCWPSRWLENQVNPVLHFNLIGEWRQPSAIHELQACTLPPLPQTMTE